MINADIKLELFKLNKSLLTDMNLESNLIFIDVNSNSHYRSLCLQSVQQMKRRVLFEPLCFFEEL